MKSAFVYCLTMLCTVQVAAQNTFKAIVKDRASKPMAGATATIKATGQSAMADSNGMVTIGNIPNGRFDITFSYIGFEEKTISRIFPESEIGVPDIMLEAEEPEEEEEEVIVTAMRTSRTIANTPTRVETISGEELEEKGNMKPGDIRMMLNESTGIQTQQTSATSYNSSIRIQGLDGKYTQLIRDGLPMYAGFSGGLSIMQIAPLDLKQVEIIKGSTSTLYGGGAIAGLVNLVSRVPADERQLNVMTNATSAGGLDIAGFYAEKYKKTGLSVFASRNSARAYDPADIGLTAIPEFERYTINPRLFLYLNDRTDFNIGFTTIVEKRTGGDLNYIEKGEPGYFEKNKTNRFVTQLSFKHQVNDHADLQVRNSFNRFNRKIEIPGYYFEGLQQSSFTELSYNTASEKMQWVMGLNVITDKFTEEKQVNVEPRDYVQNTLGAFVQNTWTASNWFTLETGLRADQLNNYGFNLLPRFSAFFNISPKLSSRIGGGLGYKGPTVFTEDAERVHFQNVLPINSSTANTERSIGFNADINYRTQLFDAVSFSLNHLFFFTQLHNPLVLTPVSGGQSEFLNANGPIDTKGMETNLRFGFEDFKLFVGYTFADVNSHFNNTKSWFPLTAKHRLNNVLMYEKEEKLKIGLEAYYFSPQKLNDGTEGRSYWIFGLMGEKLWEKFSIFINFENFSDTRQTRFDTIYTGPISNPVFKDIYAPVDGFVVNGGLKLTL